MRILAGFLFALLAGVLGTVLTATFVLVLSGDLEVSVPFLDLLKATALCVIAATLLLDGVKDDR